MQDQGELPHAAFQSRTDGWTPIEVPRMPLRQGIRAGTCLCQRVGGAPLVAWLAIPCGKLCGSTHASLRAQTGGDGKTPWIRRGVGTRGPYCCMLLP